MSYNAVKFNKDLADRILARISRGVHPRVAAQAEGIDRTTLAKWIQRGNEERRKREKSRDETFNHDAGMIAEDDHLTWDSIDQIENERFADKLYLFALKYTQAEAEAEGSLVEHIVETGKGGKLISEREDGKGNVTRTFTQPDAKPAQWILSRRFRERWGDKMSLDVVTEDGSEKHMDLSKLSTEELVIFQSMLERVTVEEDEGENGERNNETAE